MKIAHEILKEDLVKSKILNVNFLKDKDNEIFYMKTSTKLRNFYLKN